MGILEFLGKRESDPSMNQRALNADLNAGKFKGLGPLWVAYKNGNLIAKSPDVGKLNRALAKKGGHRDTLVQKVNGSDPMPYSTFPN